MTSSPYAFIPLTAPLPSAFGDRTPSHAKPEPDGACGDLTVEWVFERPVLVGGATADDQGFSSFALDSQERPTLPGATSRGLVRALIEIASGSRLDIYDRDAHFAVRDSEDERIWRPASPIPRGRALSFGWLRRAERRSLARDRDFEGWVVEIVKEAWQLETASFVPDVQSFEALTVSEKVERLRVAQRLRISARVQTKKEAPAYVERNFARYDAQGNKSGWVVVTGIDPARGGGANGAPAPKRYATLFVEQANGKVIDVPPEVMRRFIKTHNTTPGEGRCAWDFWRDQLNEGMPTQGGGEMPGVPVFIGHEVPPDIDARNRQDLRNAALLRQIEGLRAQDNPAAFYLSLSRFVKVPHRRSLRQIVDAQGHQLDAPLDFARALFGQVPPEKLEAEIEEKPGRGALKGRVFFGEASLTGAIPKTDAMIGVTMTPRASFWPYYLKPGDEPDVSQPYDYSNPTSEVAGWKRYPVRAQTTQFLRDDRPNAPQPGPHGARSTESGMRFLRATEKSPVVFRGRVRFHNLKPAEIGALLWALTWGEGADGSNRRQRHLIGRGKAQGFGMCFARIAQTRVTPNLGGAALAASAYIDAFKAHVLDAWNASVTASGRGAPAATFENLPMIAALLAMGNPAMAAGKENRLIYPSNPPRLWQSDRYSSPRPGRGMNPDSSPSLEGYKAVREAARQPGRATSVLRRFPSED